MPKFTIVSGEPRSGTSLMMQTLGLLGMPIWYKEKETRLDEARKQIEILNPRGFYELPIVSTGISLSKFQEKNTEFYQEILNNDGSAIKLVTRGLLKTDIELIGKIIFCTRNPRAIAYSQTDLIENVMVAGEGGEWIYPKRENTCVSYNFNIYEFLQKISNYTSALYVDYDNVLTEPVKEINRIIEFLKIFPTEKQIQEAITNVVPELSRNSDPPILDGPEWNLADKMYVYLTEQKPVDKSLETDIANTTKTLLEKNAWWLEESIWRMCDISMYKKIQEDSKYRKFIMSDMNKRKIKGRICNICENYNRLGKEYTINRAGLGPLKRNMVLCKELNKEVTLEECQNHWERK
jgi:hypothetical protein